MQNPNELGFVQTKSSLMRSSVPNKFEEITFTSHKKKEKPSVVNPQKKKQFRDPVPKNHDEHRSFMKKARYDIIKFGMSGFDSAKKEETKQALAISLGAIPKKQKAINYKELKEKRKKEQQEIKERQSFQSLGKNSLGLASAKIKRRSESNRARPKGDHKGGLLDVYGKVRKHQLDKK